MAKKTDKGKTIYERNGTEPSKRQPYVRKSRVAGAVSAIALSLLMSAAYAHENLPPTHYMTAKQSQEWYKATLPPRENVVKHDYFHHETPQEALERSYIARPRQIPFRWIARQSDPTRPGCIIGRKQARLIAEGYWKAWRELQLQGKPEPTRPTVGPQQLKGRPDGSTRSRVQLDDGTWVSTMTKKNRAQRRAHLQSKGSA